ncbi:acyl-CoA dehydrogenase family protein [Polymorphospora sp. NPDC050346]|uniref:acyl-CoA dehydrogenase family protein n=1 Tax=Polymorphospora sp. NPDC050346 TaxID=3155780 RepID=UPI0033E86BAF
MREVGVWKDRLPGLVAEFLAGHDPGTLGRTGFLRARFDAGLALVHHPAGLGGLDAPRELQPLVDAAFAAAGAPDNAPHRNGIGLGMAAPTILRHGGPALRERLLRPLWTGEEIWCQLFSEPGAGSDLASVATRAARVTGTDGWIVNGQKVWTSMAHRARWGLLLARTDPDLPKHQGLTYFVCDMTAPGVEVRPLRQLTGEAEFNEVFLTDVRLPDELRLGEVGQGWRVARTTLMNERVAIGGRPAPREGGMIGVLARAWRERPDRRTPGLHDELVRLWVRAEAVRLTGMLVRRQAAAGDPGPEGSAVKLSYATLTQAVSGLELDLLGADGLRYDGWEMRRPDRVDMLGRTPGYRYLRARGNSIEGGTSEILRDIIAERVLGLPAGPRADRDTAWRDVPR